MVHYFKIFHIRAWRWPIRVEICSCFCCKV